MDTVDLGALEAERDEHLRAGRKADAAAVHERLTAHHRIAALEEERRGYVARDLAERIEAVDEQLASARTTADRLDREAHAADAAAERAEEQPADAAPRERSRPPRKRA